MILKVEKFIFLNIIFSWLLLPVVVSAQSIEGVIDSAQVVLNMVIPFLMTLAVAVFVWGVMMYIASAGDAEKEKKARGRIVFGLVGLFVLVAFWGLIAIIIDTFLFSATTPGTIELPDMPIISL